MIDISEYSLIMIPIITPTFHLQFIIRITIHVKIMHDANFVNFIPLFGNLLQKSVNSTFLVTSLSISFMSTKILRV